MKGGAISMTMLVFLSAASAGLGIGIMSGYSSAWAWCAAQKLVIADLREIIVEKNDEIDRLNDELDGIGDCGSGDDETVDNLVNGLIVAD